MGQLQKDITEIEAAGIQLVGISYDSVKSHKKFIDKHNLPFDLLADEDGVVIKAFRANTPLPKTAKRITYLIGPKGTIRRAYPSVTPAQHVYVILRDLEEIAAKTAQPEAAIAPN